MSRPTTLEDSAGIGDGEEWEVIPRDWWRISYNAVSWTKTEARSECLLSRIRQRKQSLYHDNRFLSDATLTGSANEPGTPGDLELNVDLVGVRLADESLKLYEKLVGFDGGTEGSQILRFSLDDLQPRRRRIASYDTVDDDSESLRERWRRETEPLFAGISTSSPEFVIELSEDEVNAILQQSTFPSLWDLELIPPPATPVRSRTPNSMTSSIDFTESDTSEPLPATPKMTPSVESRDVAGSPSKRLNASATSFIPSSSSSSSLPSLASSSSSSLSSLPSNYYAYEDPLSPSWPSVASPPHMSISDFQFPSLPPPAIHSSPTSRLQKDEQGFYTEVSGLSDRDISRRQASTPSLPPFLGRDSPGPSRKASKTREIVDQIKHGNTVPAQRLRRSKSKLTTDTDQDREGWICAEAQVDAAAAPEEKAKRRKELVAVLGSKSKSTPAKSHDRAQSKGQDAVRSRSPARSSGTGQSQDTSKSALQKTEDGWIEGPASAPPVSGARARSKSSQRQHTRNRSSVSVLSSMPSGPPTPAVYPAPMPHIAAPLYYPGPPAPGPVPAFGYPAPAAYMPFAPYGAYPVQVPVQPVQYRAPFAAYQPYGEAPLTSKVITGAAGMRHAAW
ncbi:hypothetical protein OE88DRAFT_1659895 [Heliocybe sulcata]|uniref:Uncharacterized protein n=1 Tax=Heliocybe sulcata TaxID=5364 RepID=A0A5C3N3X1_9AGAM|nr:hypothetical protein OE88DRAFT_1659895 [Heliocybe sulcata]